jgi:hypothetical protein
MAAVPDNGIGTAGVGRNITIMNLRFAGEPELEGQKPVKSGTTISDAIRYATRNGARVIASSVGSPINDVGLDTALQEAERGGRPCRLGGGQRGPQHRCGQKL